MSFYDQAKEEQTRLWSVIGELEGKITPNPDKHKRLRKALTEAQNEHRIVSNWITSYENYVAAKAIA